MGQSSEDKFTGNPNEGFHPRKSKGVPFNDKSASTVECSLQNTMRKYQGRNECSNSPPTWVWCPLWKDGSHCGLSGPQDVPCDCKTARTVPPATTPTTQWSCSNCSQSRFLEKQAAIFTSALQRHLPLFCSTLLSPGCWLGDTKGNSSVRGACFWLAQLPGDHLKHSTGASKVTQCLSEEICAKLTAALENSSKRIF